jgi:hypothetical protein
VSVEFQVGFNRFESEGGGEEKGGKPNILVLKQSFADAIYMMRANI